MKVKTYDWGVEFIYIFPFVIGHHIDLIVLKGTAIPDIFKHLLRIITEAAVSPREEG